MLRPRSIFFSHHIPLCKSVRPLYFTNNVGKVFKHEGPWSFQGNRVKIKFAQSPTNNLCKSNVICGSLHKVSPYYENSVKLCQRNQIYASLSKLRLGSLVVVTAMFGNLMAPVPFDIGTFFWSSFGTGLAIASANTFNQYIEIESDAQMYRTVKRVLPSGRISPLHAILFGIGTGISGVGILAITTNPICAALALGNIILYALIYTPMKKLHPINTWVGAFVGAVPPMIGWVAATGNVGLGAWVMAAIMFIWQIPHFLALSWNLKTDYARAGYQMMSVTHSEWLPMMTLLWTFLFIPMGILSFYSGITTHLFIYDSLVLGMYICWKGIQFWKDNSVLNSRRLFLATNYWLPLFFLLMFLHKS